MSGAVRSTIRYPAVTIWQPWASLIAEGAKPYEFRGHAAPRFVQGKRVAIHAGLRPIRVAEIRALLVKLHSADWRDTGLDREKALPVLERAKAAPRDFPLGAILCLATLGVPITGKELARELGCEALLDSDRVQCSNYGWPLTDIERLQPFEPARGAQGWWYWQRSAA